MTGEKNLVSLLQSMKPELNEGEYVFCTVTNKMNIEDEKIILSFQEKEGTTLILKKETADKLALPYSFIAAWITLTIHSSLDGVGFTAVFSKALADNGIGCNVVAAFYHDHLFVNSKDAKKAMEVLEKLSLSSS